LDRIDFDSPDATASQALFLLQVEFVDGEPETYALPLLAEREPEEAEAPGVLLRLIDRDGIPWHVRDAMMDEHFARRLLHLTMGGGELSGQQVKLRGRSIGIAPAITDLLPRIPEREQSNSNIAFDEALMLKLYRKIGEGRNPELEVGEHLTRVGFAHAAPVAGAIEILGRGEPRTLALALQY